MPITAHLEELRRRIFVSLAAVAVGFAVTFSFSQRILMWLEIPLNRTYALQRTPPYLVTVPRDTPVELYFLAPTEPFWTHIKVAFLAGLLLAVPVIFYELWRFVSPGLLPRERRYAGPFVLLSTFFFLVGSAFCYFVVLPFAMNFLITFDAHLKPVLSVGQYVDFCIKFLLAFGLVFELPLAITLLSRMGLTTPEFLARNRKYAVLLAFVFAAILTPTPDVFNQTLMAGPMILLYEVGILAAKVFRKRKPEEAEETP